MRHKGGLIWTDKFLGAECDYNCRRIVYCDTNTQIMSHKSKCYGHETISIIHFVEFILSFLGGPWVRRELLKKNIGDKIPN